MTAAINNNVASNNAAEGVRIVVNDFAVFNNTNFSGNTVSDNGGIGVSLAASGSTFYSLNMGASGSGPAFLNTISGNVDAGFAINASGNSIGDVTVANVDVNGTTNGTDPIFNGEGLYVRLQDNSQLPNLVVGAPSVANTSFTGNASDGIRIALGGTSTLATLGWSSTISRPAVPGPAMTAGSSYGGTTV
jgi:parallel beta-helix repeat protein